MSEFETLKFSVYEPRSNGPLVDTVSVNLLVDLNCNPLHPDFVLVLTEPLWCQQCQQKGSWNTYEISKHTPIFKSISGKGDLPDYDVRRDRPAALTRLTDAYPRACFVADDIFDSAMRRNQKLPPFLLVHGNACYTDASFIRIDSIHAHFSHSDFVEDFE